VLLWRCYAEGVQVDVLYFGMLKDAFGEERATVQLAEGADVGGLLEVLQAREASAKDGVGAVWSALAVAVNREYAGRGTKLQDGDEVALLPPVSGGKDAR